MFIIGSGRAKNPLLSAVTSKTGVLQYCTLAKGLFISSIFGSKFMPFIPCMLLFMYFQVMHKLQKKAKREEDISNEVISMINLLKDWAASYHSESVRALRGFGKYRLAAAFQSFSVDPVRWLRWGTERQEQHVSAFQNFTPAVQWGFIRPKNAGLKSIGKKRRDTDEPQVFSQRINISSEKIEEHRSASSKKVTPLKIKKVGNDKYVSSKASCTSTSTPTNLTDDAYDPLNPLRIESHLYNLVHRDDKKNCPGQVTRCEQCRFNFSNADIVLVRTTGVREFTDKTGRRKRTTGNVYLHYLKRCLVEYDDKFKFSAITVLKDTLKRLPPNSVNKFKDIGLQIEP